MGKWIAGILATIISGVVVYWLTVGVGSDRHTRSAPSPLPPSSSSVDESPPNKEQKPTKDEGKTQSEELTSDNKVKARIVSRSDSNKVTIRLGSCNSTLTRTVDAGLTVTVIRHQSPDCNGFLRIADDGGSVLGWIPKDRIELLGPVQE